jgi:hypothetical protein
LKKKEKEEKKAALKEASKVNFFFVDHRLYVASPRANRKEGYSKILNLYN